MSRVRRFLDVLDNPDAAALTERTADEEVLLTLMVHMFFADGIVADSELDVLVRLVGEKDGEDEVDELGIPKNASAEERLLAARQRSFTFAHALEECLAVSGGGGGRTPRVLVVGGNERQRRHHARLEKLAAEWGFESEWLETNYTSPQKTVATIQDRVQKGVDVLVLLHWNRHETTEPALELARAAGVPARTVHYAGFTSLQVALAEQAQRLTAVAN